MRRRRGTIQQIDDATWSKLAPRIWDLLPNAAYEWNVSKEAADKLDALIGRVSPSQASPSGALDENLALRKRIVPFLRNGDVGLQANLISWIVRDWGQIKGGSSRSKPDPFVGWARELQSFTPQVIDAFIIEHGVDRIASWSKVLAFADADAYAIYDTRVAVTLNLALTALGEDCRFFRPESQNRRVSQTAAFVGRHPKPLGYLDYLALLRAVGRSHGESLLSAEVQLFSLAPGLADRFVKNIDRHVERACADIFGL